MDLDYLVLGETLKLKGPEALIKNTAESRFRLFEENSDYNKHGFVQISDAAYKTLAELTKNNVGFSLQVINLAVKTYAHEPKPIIIIKNTIRQLNLTYEQISNYWDVKDQIIVGFKKQI